jgi:hypothetical protein
MGWREWKTAAEDSGDSLVDWRVVVSVRVDGEGTGASLFICGNGMEEEEEEDSDRSPASAPPPLTCASLDKQDRRRQCG